MLGAAPPPAPPGVPFFRREQFEKPFVIDAIILRTMCFDGFDLRRDLAFAPTWGLIFIGAGFSIVMSSLVLVVLDDAANPESADSSLSGEACSEHPS